MNWVIRFSDRAEKDFLSIQGPDRVRITKRLLDLETQLRPVGDGKLKGSPLYRLRIGDWRAIFEIDDKLHRVWITRLLRRSEKTYRDL